MIVCDSSSHDELTSGPEGSPGLQDAVPPQLPQSHVWHYDGLLEGGRTGSAHIRDPAVEAGGLLRPGCNVIWRRWPLLAYWPGCGGKRQKIFSAVTQSHNHRKSKHEHTMFLWSCKCNLKFRSFRPNEGSEMFENTETVTDMQWQSGWVATLLAMLCSPTECTLWRAVYVSAELLETENCCYLTVSMNRFFLCSA